jgi:hypothetical protein
MLPYRIGALAVVLCRFVRDSADSDAGLCRVVPVRSVTYEQAPSNHSTRMDGLAFGRIMRRFACSRFLRGAHHIHDVMMEVRIDLYEVPGMPYG